MLHVRDFLTVVPLVIYHRTPCFIGATAAEKLEGTSGVVDTDPSSFSSFIPASTFIVPPSNFNHSFFYSSRQLPLNAR